MKEIIIGTKDQFTSFPAEVHVEDNLYFLTVFIPYCPVFALMPVTPLTLKMENSCVRCMDGHLKYIRVVAIMCQVLDSTRMRSS